MSWERYGTWKYYYSARKVDGRVRKEYLGRGPVAALASRLEDEARTRRRVETESLVHERARLAEPDAAVVTLSAACTVALNATLMAAGFHRQNYGPWRRRHE